MNKKIKQHIISFLCGAMVAAILFSTSSTLAERKIIYPQLSASNKSNENLIMLPKPTESTESITEHTTDEPITEQIAERVITAEDLYAMSYESLSTNSREMIAEIFATEVEPEPEWEYIGKFTLTAYCLCAQCCGIWSKQHPSRINDKSFIQRTASGTIPTVGKTVGANISVLPFGTIIYIDGIGEFTVEDTGGAARRNKYLIDILFGTHREALEFGVQTADVWVKNESYGD